MPAYVIASVTITDPVAFDAYRAQVPETIARHGGRYLVRGGPLERLEGDWSPRRLIVLEFPSLEAARGWYESEDYRAPRALRWRAATSDVVLVDGV
jgi:uncharacterized protein (DUF1330 family)